ncbi:MAG: MMPL family transporter [Phycisphaerae bacterium]
MKFGNGIVRYRWLVLTAWVVAAILLVALVGQSDPANEIQHFLPEDMPYRKAIAALEEHFPENSGLSNAIIVFERKTGPLQPTDLQAIEQIARRISDPSETEHATAEELDRLTIQTPASTSFLMFQSPLVSKAGEPGQAALISVSVPSNYVTLRASHVVEHIRGVLQKTPLPDGLSVSVTGSAAFGHDYAKAAKESHEATTIVTLLSVIVILLLVYRAPLAALVPLLSITVAAVVAMKFLVLAESFGVHNGTAEQIFVFVLLYGAGIDYSLLYISRYREMLQQGQPGRKAAADGLNATIGAIMASSVTDTLGLLMLCFAAFVLFQTTGPVAAIALLIALMAAVTLVPALVAIVGPRMFWPRKTHRIGKSRVLWSAVGRLVTRRPLLLLVLLFAALAVPATRGFFVPWDFDSLAGLKPNAGKVGNASRGIRVARRHWPVGEVAPVTIVLESDESLARDQWREISARASTAAMAQPKVKEVRSHTYPIGNRADVLSAVDAIPLLSQTAKTQIRKDIDKQYLAPTGRAIRMDLVLNTAPFESGSMEALEDIQQEVAAAARTGDPAKLTVHTAGIIAQTRDTREITDRDFARVAPLVLGVIFLVVVILIRDPVIAAFMVLSTLVSYLATLGISHWVFTGLFGAAALDWKVRIFVFVVMVAVGVDYNIFLAARLAQEARSLPTAEAVRRAVAYTGPVISSCGIIMAATLGSLVVGKMSLLEQLGFALALGMLIDTFLIRPLLLPAFATLTGRTGKTWNFMT